MMPQPQLDYRPATSDRKDSVSEASLIATLIMATVLIGLNAVLLHMAAVDRSWSALGIALVYGPIANGVLMLASLCCAPLIKHVSGGRPVSLFATLSLLLPILAAGFDFIVIGAMGLQGC